MEWTDENVIKFLELFEAHPCIWDPYHDSNNNQLEKSEAWIDIKNKMGEPFTVEELKKKQESLLSSYITYKTKIMTFQALDKTKIFRVTWPPYAYMEKFLGPIYNTNTQAEDKDCQDEETMDTSAATGELAQNMNNASQTATQQAPANPAQPIQEEPKPILSRRRQHSPDTRSGEKLFRTDEDESSIYGKLIVKKMRKLNSRRRSYMMLRINEIICNEILEQDSENQTQRMSFVNGMASPFPLKTIRD